MGGGLVLGAITLLYEDSHSQFYSHFIKTILAEGIVNKQHCIIVESKDTFRDQSTWLKFLPSVSKLKDNADTES